MSDACHDPISAARAHLGVERLLLGIHDASFPCDPDEDVGRGSPATRAGRRVLELAHASGFTGLQLGPRGLLAEGNASPYDGAQFSRDTLSIPLLGSPGDDDGAVTLARSVRHESRDAAIASRPHGPAERTQHRHAHAAMDRLLDEAYLTFVRAPPAERAPFERWLSAQGEWLTRDAHFEWLRRIHHGEDWTSWGGTPEAEVDRTLHAPPPGGEEAAVCRRAALEVLHGGAFARFAFGQWLVHETHAAVRRHARSLGLALFGDLQIGFSPRDEWAARRQLLDGYRLGAPPSRTTPAGQPWNYPVLDPDQVGDEGASGGGALAWLTARFRKMLGEHDGVRIDHPHGYVCPWVYRAADPDALHAVRHGARLFESPDLPDHPALARFARVARGDLNPDPARARFADDWVVALSGRQIERFAGIFDALVAVAREHGRAPSSLVCEVLSTLPHPLARVLARHGLGRFRVLQKADPRDPGDVYHVANAHPEDWVMLGNHDTPPIWNAVEQWSVPERRDPWVADLSARLALAPAHRTRVAVWLARADGALVHALFASLLASPARNVMLFWTDLFGAREPYNTPGTVSERNWSLRLTHDFAERHRERCRAGLALDLPFALSLALRMRGTDADPEARALVGALESASHASLRFPGGGR